MLAAIFSYSFMLLVSYSSPSLCNDENGCGENVVSNLQVVHVTETNSRDYLNIMMANYLQSFGK